MFEESVLGLPKQTQKFVYKNVDWELFIKQYSSAICYWWNKIM